LTSVKVLLPIVSIFGAIVHVGGITMHRLAFPLAALGLIAGPAVAEVVSSVDPGEVLQPKQTELGLYLSAEDAAAAMESDPGILFVDVRDPLEAMFVGLPDGVDVIVPARLATHQFDAERGRYQLAPNPGFAGSVAAVATAQGIGKDDPIIVICQAGRRAAGAANTLGEAGFTNVWAVVDGFSGDLDPDTGRRDVNGWVNSGLPWSYQITPEQAWTPEG
jgi:rhodanese-related sulfurtransferase